MDHKLKMALSKTAAIAIAVILILVAIAGIYYAMMPAPSPSPTPSPSPSPSPTPTETTPPSSSPSPSPSPTPTETTPPPSPSPTPAVTKTFHKRVIYIINNDATARIQLYKAGVADRAVVPLDRLKDVEGAKLGNYEIVVERDPNFVTLTIIYGVFNTAKEPLNNVLVRQALVWATPYQTIYDKVYAGFLVPLRGIIPKGLIGFTEHNVIDYTYDMSKARELIEKSGIDPSQYTITIYYNIGNDQRAQVSALLANTWGRLGFNIVIQPLNWPVLLGKVAHGEFDYYTIGWVPDYLDPDNYAGPLFYGGTEFKEVNILTVESSAEISNLLKDAKVFDTEEAYVVVGEKGTGASVPELTGKKIIVVQYVPDWEATFTIEEAMEKGWGFSFINPYFYRNVTADALIIAGRQTADVTLRKPIYEAVFQISNYEVPGLWLGQEIFVRTYWNWVGGIYYHPTLANRYDLVWEHSDAPVADIGIKDYKNDPETYVIATIGWPDTFDPAKSYETFGWEIFLQVGDTLVTYWKEETEEVSPDLAVAWAHDESGTEWYFVIRGGVVAYDPWNDKTYPIDATDVLFEFWRLARSQLDPTWMISEFIDVNSSKVLTEEEFNSLLSEKPLKIEWRGKAAEVHSLDELLSFFGYKEETAGVVMFKLYSPYAPFLSILADPFTMVIPAEYMLEDKYEEAMEASEWGKNPSAWAEYVQPGEDDAIHQLVKDYLVGTGPFYVKEYEVDSYIVLEFNPYYWNATIWEQTYGFKP